MQLQKGRRNTSEIKKKKHFKKIKKEKIIKCHHIYIYIAVMMTQK